MNGAKKCDGIERHIRLKPLFILLRLEPAVPVFIHQDYGAFLALFVLVVLNIFAEAHDSASPNLRARIGRQILWAGCFSMVYALTVYCRLLATSSFRFNVDVFLIDVVSIGKIAGGLWCATSLCRVSAIVGEYACAILPAKETRSDADSGKAGR